MYLEPIKGGGVEAIINGWVQYYTWLKYSCSEYHECLPLHIYALHLDFLKEFYVGTPRSGAKFFFSFFITR